MDDTSQIVEGAWSTNSSKKDISYDWVKKLEDIQLIEAGVNILEFCEKTSRRNPEMEFRLIKKITETKLHNDELREANSKVNKLNRYVAILPYKSTEVQIEEEEGDCDDNGICYINASFIDSIHRGEEGQKRYIATQGPKPESFSQFWKMIWDKQTQCIIMLCNLKVSSKSYTLVNLFFFKEDDKIKCDQYWPLTVGSSAQYGKISIHFEEEDTIYESVIKRKFVATKENCDISLIINQYQMINWRDHSAPDINGKIAIDYLVDIMIEEYSNNRISVIHCSAGIGRTGALISLANLVMNLRHHIPTIRQAFESGNTDLETNSELKKCTLSVFGTVRRLREQRWGMVQQTEQYGYLYKYMRLTIESELFKIKDELRANE